MKHSVLIVQFRTDASAIHEQTYLPDKFIGSNPHDITFHFLNAFDASSSWNKDPRHLLDGYDSVILGGSSEFYFGGNVDSERETIHRTMIDRIRPLITYIIDNDFPTLGICFGHQMLGYFLGARVLDDPAQAEFGSFPVSLSENGRRDPLFRDVPDDFVSFLMHRDSLASLPEECVLLAHSSKCGIGSFRYKNNIYGVQFHPELGKDEVCFRATLHPEYAGGSLETFLETLQPAEHAPKILANFLRRSLC